MKCLIAVSNAQLALRIAGSVRYVAAEICPPDQLAVRARVEDGLVIVDEAALELLQKVQTGAQLLCVSERAVGDNVQTLARFSRLSQLVTPAFFDGSQVARLLFGLIRQHDAEDVDTLAFLGSRRVHVHRVLLYRSLGIEKRLDRIVEFAEQAGARPRAVEALREIGHELLVNAFYDAPFEAGDSEAPAARQAAVQLPPDRPCEVVYGAINDELILRVRDCFGALSRTRLLEVLLRCAERGDSASFVALDESRGGAGLGLWTVFRKSSRVVISVDPNRSTEVLVTVPMAGLGRHSLRAWHLLFAGARA